MIHDVPIYEEKESGRLISILFDYVGVACNAHMINVVLVHAHLKNFHRCTFFEFVIKKFVPKGTVYFTWQILCLQHLLLQVCPMICWRRQQLKLLGT